MSNYTYVTVLEYAEKIINEIGVKRIYIKTNKKHPSAPANYIFRNPKVLIPVVKRRLRELKTPKKIHLISVLELDALEGLYANIDKNLYICYSDKISDCWKRFTIIKELCSAYTAHYQDNYKNRKIYECDEDFEKSIDDAYLHKTKYIDTDHLYDGDIDSETFAILLATEVMISRQYRKITEELIIKVNEDKLKLNDVAKSLMIPETILKIHIAKKYL